MNLIGHFYIASEVIGKASSFTLLGSHVPDFVPFLPSSVFTFDEIHENHEGLLAFVRANYPDVVEFPLSMMCHSVKYGADKYNREIDSWLLENDDNFANEISQLISDASGISYEMARGPRLHNYLWCGVDVYLIKTNTNQVISNLITSLNGIDIGITARILSEYYNKDQNLVRANLVDHFSPITMGTAQSVEGFVAFWSKFLSGLPEKDQLDVIQGIEIVELIYKKFEDEWEGILGMVKQKVAIKINPLLLPAFSI